MTEVRGSDRLTRIDEALTSAQGTLETYHIGDLVVTNIPTGNGRQDGNDQTFRRATILGFYQAGFEGLKFYAVVKTLGKNGWIQTQDVNELAAIVRTGSK